MEAIDVMYFWEGSVLPNKNLDFTISKSCLIDLIDEMAKKHVRPYMRLGRLKREVNQTDLDKRIKWVEIYERVNLDKSRYKELVLITVDGYRYELKEKPNRKMVS